jgi:phosphoglycolate phosphatase-like HAD superfamily hydrolase
MIYALFDIDNTLVYIEDGVDEDSSRIMFKKIFKVDADESFVETYSKTEQCIISDVLKKVGQPQKIIPNEAYQAWGEALVQILISRPARVLPGIIELLSDLSKNKNVKLNLLTGNSVPRSESKLKSAQLDDFFRNKQTGRLEGIFGEISKVRGDLLKFFRLQLNPDDKVIIIDDSLLGAKMSKEQNVPIISVATGKIKEEELRSYTPFVFLNFAENRWKKAVEIITSI